MQLQVKQNQKRIRIFVDIYVEYFIGYFFHVLRVRKFNDEFIFCDAFDLSATVQLFIIEERRKAQ